MLNFFPHAQRRPLVSAHHHYIFHHCFSAVDAGNSNFRHGAVRLDDGGADDSLAGDCADSVGSTKQGSEKVKLE